MSIMMKKGISKEYEVESLILNEENVDKLFSIDCSSPKSTKTFTKNPTVDSSKAGI